MSASVLFKTTSSVAASIASTSASISEGSIVGSCGPAILTCSRASSCCCFNSFALCNIACCVRGASSFFESLKNFADVLANAEFFFMGFVSAVGSAGVVVVVVVVGFAAVVTCLIVPNVNLPFLPIEILPAA